MPAAKDLFVHERTLARVAAGAAVHQATATLMQQRLTELLEDEARRAAEQGPPVGIDRRGALRLVPQDHPEQTSSDIE